MKATFDGLVYYDLSQPCIYLIESFSRFIYIMQILEINLWTVLCQTKCKKGIYQKSFGIEVLTRVGVRFIYIFLYTNDLEQYAIHGVNILYTEDVFIVILAHRLLYY